MSHMKFSETLTLDTSQDVIERRISKYMTRIGYQLVSAQDGHYVLNRGSMWGSSISLNPRKLKTNVNIDVVNMTDQYHIIIAYDVNTSGHFILPYELDYWDQEIEMLVFFLTDGKYKSAELDDIANQVLNTNHRIMMGFVILTLVFIVGTLLLSLTCSC